MRIQSLDTSYTKLYTLIVKHPINTGHNKFWQGLFTYLLTQIKGKKMVYKEHIATP